MFGPLRRRFGTISWKLAGSYVLVTVLSALVLEIILVSFLAVFTVRSGFIQESVAGVSHTIADLLRSDFEAPDRTPEQLGRQLTAIVATNNDPLQLRIEYSPSSSETSTPTVNQEFPLVVLIDQQGRVLTSTFQAAFPQGAILADMESPQAAILIARALQGATETSQIAYWDAPFGQSMAAAPVVSRQGQVIGVVYNRFPSLPIAGFVWGIASFLLFSTILFLLFSALIGLVFGLVAGRGFTRRVRRLSAASATLAAGDLDRRVEDRSPDEIGQLAEQFNAMADQLAQNMRELRLLAEQNARLAEQSAQLAAVEERNRLARDLHDSVSQELFSLTMLAAAARRVIERKPELVAVQLGEIQDTAQRALQETRSLILALRPAALEGRGLVPALRDLATSAQDRQGLSVELAISGERRLPLEHEQALFRIAQEALANVARHSGVRAAQIALDYEDSLVRLTIADHGRGFDPSMPRSARSIGLASMSERASALGGALLLESACDHGATVTVILPI